jgi:hypothetical protein
LVLALLHLQQSQHKQQWEAGRSGQVHIQTQMELLPLPVAAVLVLLQAILNSSSSRIGSSRTVVGALGVASFALLLLLWATILQDVRSAAAARKLRLQLATPQAAGLQELQQQQQQQGQVAMLPAAAAAAAAAGMDSSLQLTALLVKLLCCSS